MKRVYFTLFVLSVLVFNSCCKSWFSQTTKHTEKCQCEEFENYIKTWKTDKETGVLYVDRKHEDRDSYIEFENIFLKRLDCLKGKKVGYARKLFQGKSDEIHIIIPKSKECLDCYVKRGDCEYVISGKVYCYNIEIQISDDDEKVITATSENLEVTGHHYVWLFIK